MEVGSNLSEILGHSVKCSVLGIQDTHMSAEYAYKNSKVASEVLVDSLLECTDLNYVLHNYIVCRSRKYGWNQREFLVTKGLTQQKELSERERLNRLWQATENVAWITATTHQLIGTELSRGEF